MVVWPFGTKVVDTDPLTIEIPEKGTFALGQEVNVGGGFVLEHSSSARTSGPLEVSGVTVPTDCADHDVFLALWGRYKHAHAALWAWAPPSAGTIDT